MLLVIYLYIRMYMELLNTCCVANICYFDSHSAVFVLLRVALMRMWFCKTNVYFALIDKVILDEFLRDKVYCSSQVKVPHEYIIPFICTNITVLWIIPKGK